MWINIVLVIHLILAIGLVGVVLLQRSEGGGLGIGGGGGGGMGGLMSGRGTANFLTRATAFLAGLFMVTSLTLAFLSGQSRESRSIVEDLSIEQQLPSPPSEPAAPIRE